jgi:hypothetical protein
MDYFCALDKVQKIRSPNLAHFVRRTSTYFKIWPISFFCTLLAESTYLTLPKKVYSVMTYEGLKYVTVLATVDAG